MHQQQKDKAALGQVTATAAAGAQLEKEEVIAKSVDTRGMACPYPSFEAVKALTQLKAGQTIEVITDSGESALESIPSVCQRRKWDFAVSEEGKGLWKVRITKKIAS